MATAQLSVKEIFLQAVEIASPADRAAYLDQACEEDVERRMRVEALLIAHERPESLVDRPAVNVPPPGVTTDRTSVERPGTRIGRYRLMEQIGEGGMGTVWVAEQTEPVKRRVALKVIKPGMDSRQVLSRFEAERQALALMDHPNIAKVFDGGMTDEGRPYFVMEYVKGMPITEYCDNARLSIQDRLKLFVPVCQAVQHAHQKGVIHRDLKPNNILVCLYDGNPVPKVIDFGLAKAISQPLTENTLYTAHGLMVGTPLYMSPEQAEFNNLDVDTRSDIYSLGVLLYELLTGTTPLEKRQFKDAAFQEILRLIKEVEPTRPSLKISTSESLPSIAAQRSLEPAQLSRTVRGDLDWIVMKALEKERSRRYETANGLARDIDRYLSDEPVEASPPSAAYRLKKVIRRNKGPALAAALVLLTLIGGIIGTTLGLIHAESSRRAEAKQRQLADTAAAAERQAKDAEIKQRLLAETNEKLAKSERDRAQQAELLAAQETTKATRATESEAQTRSAAVEAAKQTYQAQYVNDMNRVQRQWDLGHVDLVRNLLLRHQPEGEREDLRSFEWYYWWRMSHRDSLTIPHHAPVKCVALSPNQKVLATASEETIMLWDVASGQRTGELIGHHSFVNHIAFSPDGSLLASAGGGRSSPVNTALKLWDVMSREELATLWEKHGGHWQDHSAWVSSVAFSPDGALVAAAVTDKDDPNGPGDSVRLWEVRNRSLVTTFAATSVNGVAFSPDGQTLASFSKDGELKLWSVASQELLTQAAHALPGPSPSFLSFGSVMGASCVAFSRDGKTLASARTNGAVKLWDVPTLRERTTLRQDGNAGVYSLAFSPQKNTLATGNADGTIRIWDFSSAELLTTIKAHTALVHSVAFSSDGRKLASGGGPGFGSKTGDAKLWDIAEDQPQDLLNGQGSHNRLAFSPDGRMLCSGGADNVVKLWDTITGKELTPLRGHTSYVESVAFSPDRQTVASGAADKTIRLWDISTRQLRTTLQCPPGYIADCLSFSPNGRLLAAGCGNYLKLWDVSSSKEITTVRGHAVSSVAFHPDGQMLAARHIDGRVRLWSVPAGTELAIFPGRDAGLTAFALSPSGTLLAAGSAGGAVTVFNVATQKELLTLQGHLGRISSVAFSLDGKCLASASEDGEVILWDVIRGEQKTVLDGPAVRPCLAFSPDGQTLASGGGDNRIILWRAATEAEVLARSKLQSQIEVEDPLRATVRLANAYFNSGRALEAVELLEEVRSRLVAKSETDSSFFYEALYGLAHSYRRAQKWPQSIEHFQRLLDHQTSKYGPDHSNTLATLEDLSATYERAGRLSEAVPLLEQLRDRHLAKFGPDHLQTLTTQHDLANAYRLAGRFSEAIPLFEQFAVPLHEQLRDKSLAKLGPDHSQTLTTQNDLALAYQAAGRLPEALRLFEETVSRARRVRGPAHEYTITETQNWASALDAARQFAKAAEVRRELLEIQRKQFPATDPRLASALLLVGQSLLKARQFAEAEAFLRECLTIREQVLPDDWYTFNAKSNLGAALAGQKKVAEAEPLLLAGYEGLKQRESKIPANFRALRLTEALQRLIDLYTAWGKFDKAIEVRRELLDIQRKQYPATDPRLGTALADLGNSLLRNRQFAEAEPVLKECITIREQALPDNWLIFNAKSLLGEALGRQEKYAEAAPLLLSGYEGLKARETKIPANFRTPRLREALQRLIDLYTAWDKPDEAAKWRAAQEAQQRP